MTKYNSHKVQIDGVDFDSKAEAARYSELLLLLLAGEISDLRCHPVWVLQPGFQTPNGHKIRAITYQADFSYIENEQLVVEDVKPRWDNRKDGAWRVFRLKAKMMLYQHGVDVKVVEG